MERRIEMMAKNIIKDMDRKTKAIDVILDVVDSIMEATDRTLISDYNDIYTDRKRNFGRVTAAVVCEDKKIHRIVLTMVAEHANDLPLENGDIKVAVY